MPPPVAESNISLETVHAAARAVGAKPSRLTGKRFSFNSRACHAGDNPAGCWAVEQDGRVTLHCHKCDFPASDRQIRSKLGLPPWEPGYTADKPGYAGQVEQREWEYKNPTTGETAVQCISYYPAGQCPNGQHRPDGRCKHPYLVRGEGFAETPIDGFNLRFHPADSKTFPFLTICEGQDPADKAAAAGYPGLSYLGGCNNAAKADYALCKNQRVAVAPDNDLAGEVAALTAAVKALEAGAAGVYILPPATDAFTGADLADISPDERQKYLSRAAQMQLGDWLTDLDRLRFDLAVAGKRLEMDNRTRRDGRPLIPADTNREFDKHLGMAWRAVLLMNAKDPERPRVLRRFSTTATIGEGDDGPAVMELPPVALRTEFAKAAFWAGKWKEATVCPDPAVNGDYIKATAAVNALKVEQPFGRLELGDSKEGKAWIHFKANPRYPVQQLVDSAAKTPDPRLPVLAGMTRYPILASSGLLERNGYHPETRGWLELPEMEMMTGKAGAKLWRDFLADFPFADERADLAGAVALALTPLIHWQAGVAPMACLDKPDNRVGATLLSSVIATAVTGQLPYDLTYTPDGDEFHKRTATAYSDGATLIRMDNVAVKVNDPTLAACLTNPTPKFRRLGRLDSIVADGRYCSWMMTGRAVDMTTELLGRTHLIQLDAQDPEPGSRIGPTTGPRKGEAWQYPDILSAALEMRPQLLGALAAMTRDWVKAGRPGPAAGVPTVGGFEAWREIVGGILHLHGFDGFLAKYQEFKAGNDEARNEAQAFIEEWWQQYQGRAVTVGDLAAVAGLDGGDEGNEEPLVDLETQGLGKVAQRTKFARWINSQCLKRLYLVEDERLVHCITAGKGGRGGRKLYRLAQQDDGLFPEPGSPWSPRSPFPPRFAGESFGGNGQNSEKSPEHGGGKGDRGDQGDPVDPAVAAALASARETGIFPADVVIPCSRGCGRALGLQDPWMTGNCRFCKEVG